MFAQRLALTRGNEHKAVLTLPPCLHAELVLNGCSLSLAALPALRPGMRRLRRLTLHARNCADVQGSVLKTVLLLLCRPHGSTAPLEEVQFLDCPPHVDVQGCVRSVQEQLESDFGVRGVKVMVT